MIDFSEHANAERIAVIMFDSFKTDYSTPVRNLEHIKLAKNVRRIDVVFAAGLFTPITALMQSAIVAGQLSGEARFVAHLIMGIITDIRDGAQ